MEKLPRLTSLLRDPPADVGDLITIDLLHWLLNKKQLTLKSCSPDVVIIHQSPYYNVGIIGISDTLYGKCISDF